MWILVRVLAIVVGGCARLWAQSRVTPNYPRSNPQVFLREYRRRQKKSFFWTRRPEGKIYKIRFAVPCDIKLAFKITWEGATDKFFKNIGLAEEVQTGDGPFDNSFYVACDHLGFQHWLSSSRDNSDLVAQLLGSLGAEALWCDGNNLWLEAHEIVEPDASTIEALLELRQQLMRLNLSHLPVDPFAKKILAIELIIWSIAGYALVTVGEILGWKQGTIYLDSVTLFRQGLAIAIIFSVLGISSCIFLLRGSSRFHRVIFESALVLVLAVPIAGVNFWSDLNQQLDSKPAVVQPFVLKRKWVTGSKSKTYHFEIELMGNKSVQLPQTLTVSPSIYYRANLGTRYDVHVKRGRFDLPWIEKIERAS